MEVKDLKPKQGNVEVTIEVIDKGDVREFEKFGKKGRVCSAKAKDASGEIILSLWNEQVDTVNVGDVVHVVNGYVNEFQGEKQLTTGKFGKLEHVTKGAPKVYTNAPAKEFSDEMKEMGMEGEELSEEPVDDEEYIG